MFNVRPNALSPWLHVEPPPMDEPPGFRMNPDGSVRDTPRAAPRGPFGFDPSVSSSPSMGTGFHDVMRLTPGNVYSDDYLTGLSGLASPPRHPLQNALDQIMRIYAGFAPGPSDPFKRQGSGTDVVSPIGSLPPHLSQSLPLEPVVTAPPASGNGPLMPTGTASASGGGFADPESAGPRHPIEPPWPFAKTAAPIFVDRSAGVPQSGSNHAADPNIVRVGNVEAAETGVETQVAQAEQGNRGTESRGKVEDPLGALGHYMWGSGKTLEYPFKQIDTSGVKPSQFGAVADIVHRGQPGTYKIEGKMPFSTRNLNARYLVGNVTLNITGTLVLDEEGNYSFKGELGAEPDRYRFYSSDHRDTDAEIATRFGKWLPGREFTVVISGRNPISENGKYR